MINQEGISLASGVKRKPVLVTSGKDKIIKDSWMQRKYSSYSASSDPSHGLSSEILFTSNLK